VELPERRAQLARAVLLERVETAAVAQQVAVEVRR